MNSIYLIDLKYSIIKASFDPIQSKIRSDVLMRVARKYFRNFRNNILTTIKIFSQIMATILALGMLLATAICAVEPSPTAAITIQVSGDIYVPGELGVPGTIERSS